MSQASKHVEWCMKKAKTEIEECKKLGLSRIWMQPGAESDKAIEFCNKNDIKVIYNNCVMVN